MAERFMRFALLGTAGISLLLALAAGLIRMGWPIPLPLSDLPAWHGPLFIVGFLGTLIGLERSVAMDRKFFYTAPLCSALVTWSYLFGFAGSLPQMLALGSGIILNSIYIFLFRKQPTDFFGIMGLGAVCFLLGNGLWLAGFPFFRIAPWWLGFLVLTIAGERLELSRVKRYGLSDRLKFYAAVGVVLVGLLVSLFFRQWGMKVAGFGLLALSLWLFLYDLAWSSVGQAGQPRLMAISLLTGYVWLAFGGLLWIGSRGIFGAGLLHDAMLHSIFLGFVFSMIFAHAPLIFPSVTGLVMPYRSSFYFHLVLFHGSLLLRIGADVNQWLLGHQWGGFLNALAILIFLIASARSVFLARSQA